MKSTRRFLSVIAAISVLISTFSSSAFAEENRSTGDTENRVNVSVLIDKLNASTSGIPSDILFTCK